MTEVAEATEAETITKTKPRGRPAKTEPAKTENVVEAVKPPKMYKVTINSGEDKGDKGDVFLAHNFKSVLIQRDQEVTISEYFLDCLKNSMIETRLKGEDGIERLVKIPRFSYSVAPA